MTGNLVYSKVRPHVVAKMVKVFEERDREKLKTQKVVSIKDWQDCHPQGWRDDHLLFKRT